MICVSISALAVHLRTHEHDKPEELEVLGCNIPKALRFRSICPHRNVVSLPLSSKRLVTSDYLIVCPSILVGTICIAEIDAVLDGEEAAEGVARIG